MSGKAGAIFRTISAVIIIAVAGYIFFWYFVLKREVPAHARVIPSDAFAVMTFNIRELSDCVEAHEHLISEPQHESVIRKELEPFIKAAENGEGSGLNYSSDILLFAYHKGEAAYFGISVQLEDSAVFGKFVRDELRKEMNLTAWNDAGSSLMRLDTTAGVLGWSRDAMLFLYPIGNHGIAHTSVQCLELLKQAEEKSVMMNENFRKHELQTFDAGLWIQSDPLLKFTDGGSLVVQLLHDLSTISYTLEFNDGEILARSEWYLKSKSDQADMKEIPLPCNADDVSGLVRFLLHTKDKTLCEQYVSSPPVDFLPLSKEEAMELLPMLTGNCAIIMHDTFFVSQDTGRLISQTPQAGIRGMSITYEAADEQGVFKLLDEVMKRDSVPGENGVWKFSDAGQHTRMILDGKLLTVTNFPGTDGRSHQITPELYSLMFYLDISSYLKSDQGTGMLSWFFPDYLNGYDAISAEVLTASGNIPVQSGDMRWSQFTVQFRNKEINALQQIEDIVTRVYYSNR